MSDDADISGGSPAGEMAQYLQLYLDETAEQLESLVESLLVLESNPEDVAQLNESFRLIHSVKGSSAMMGLDGVTTLAHHLENRFEKLRSGDAQLDRASMELFFRCIDFLRESNRRLRAGETLASAPELIAALDALDGATAPLSSPQTDPQPAGPEREQVCTSIPVVQVEGPGPASRNYRVFIRFEPQLQLADLKAELVLARLSAIGTIGDTLPTRADFITVEESRAFQVLLSTTRTSEELRAAANVDGVELLEVEADATAFAIQGAPVESGPPTKPAGPFASMPTIVVPRAPESALSGTETPTVAAQDSTRHAAARIPAAESGISGALESADSKSRVAETVRVDIARLDNLMNLAGELVVNKAQFVQIARQMGPAFKKSSLSGKARTFGESMRRAIGLFKAHAEAQDGTHDVAGFKQFQELEGEIDAFEEQSRLWEETRRGFLRLTEAIDQMTRVSNGLQRSVLDTRMVPVAPLFNRFKRLVRDISLELGKKVNLEILGEQTELDKRMIDELGDPLVHLVRNAIDHGIEATDVRLRRGKPETGTICLEASHSGNNVLISVRDDGGGIDAEKIRHRIVERGLASQAVADALSEQETLEYIWHPGFSTADVVSDISGRGVGMDIVRTRIGKLNGAVDVSQASGRGTTFTIRLPLTLAIIRSLLFRLRHGMFAVPIENVREIVSVPIDRIVNVHGKRTFEVRGEYIPLVDIDEVFTWHRAREPVSNSTDSGTVKALNVVILHSGEKTVGLHVDELQGGQDIVIKSLAENFVHIRGLSGASIMGDGSVCLLLDMRVAIEMATVSRRPRTAAAAP